TLGAQGFRQTPLRAGVVLQFEPGTIHRLVNDGELRILVIMQNGGLPEAGDAVLTLPPEHLTDRASYDAVTALPEQDARARARSRRDLSVDGFTRLRAAVEADGPAALERFYVAAAALVRPYLDEWHRRWESGPRRAVDDTGRQLTALAEGDLRH